MNFRQLEYFLAVSSLGSFTAASQRLGVAQPTITKSMRALEIEMGVALLERLPRGVALTPSGEILKRHAERIGVQLQDALAEVTSLSSMAQGTVTIGAGPSWLRRLLPEAVASIIAHSPAVRINVVGGFDDVLLKALRARELDFGACRWHGRVPPDFVTRRLGIRFPMAAWALAGCSPASS
jgi:LysR family transcriptional regulator of gallate degradation